MVNLNLIANSPEEQIVLQHLIPQVNDVLAEKINNGACIVKEGRRLLNKKDLSTFMQYAAEQAKKQLAEKQRKDAQAVCVQGDDIMNWAIHYFEEDSIEGTIYNEDGTEYKPTPAKCRKVETFVKTTVIPPKPAPKPQLNIFDMMSNRTDNDEQTEHIDLETGEIIRAEQADGCIKTEQLTPEYFIYSEMKKAHPDFILFQRLGDFYEAFLNDAVIASNELGLTLTSKEVGLHERIPLVGIPCHAAQTYFDKLFNKGYTVKVIENNELKTMPEDDEPDEIEELSVEEMRQFDGYMDDGEEIPTVSKITEGVKTEDDDSGMISESDINAYFDKEALIDLFDVLGDKVDLV